MKKFLQTAIQKLKRITDERKRERERERERERKRVRGSHYIVSTNYVGKN